MMCQCRLVNCNRCTIQMQNADSMTEGDERCVGTLHILSFAVKIKNKIYYQKKKKNRIAIATMSKSPLSKHIFITISVYICVNIMCRCIHFICVILRSLLSLNPANQNIYVRI